MVRGSKKEEREAKRMATSRSEGSCCTIAEAASQAPMGLYCYVTAGAHRNHFRFIQYALISRIAPIKFTIQSDKSVWDIILANKDIDYNRQAFETPP
jgi:hypothetical protein